MSATTQPETPNPPTGGSQAGTSDQIFLPQPRNPAFTGRETALATLDQAFAEVSIAALVTDGNLGKTQVALEYAYRYHQRHPDHLVHWINAATLTAISNSYGQLADQIALVYQPQEKIDVIIRLVRNWLANTSRWLLIFDGLDDPAVLAQLTNYLPRKAAGKVLITSRLTMSAHGVSIDGQLVDLRVVTVAPFTEADAQALFINCAGQAIDPQLAQELALLLACCPLAITQAAGYLAALSPDHDPVQYHHHVQQFFQQYQAAQQACPDTPAAITTEIAIKALVNNQIATVGGRATAELVITAALLTNAPMAVFRQYHHSQSLEALAQENPGAAAPLAHFEATLNELRAGARKLALIIDNVAIDNVASDSFALLPAVQAAILRRLIPAEPVSEMKHRIENLAAVLKDLFPDPQTVATAPECERQLLTVLSLLHHITQYQVATPEIGLLLTKAGIYCNQRERYREAEALYCEALRVRQQALGTQHPAYAASANNLAGLYKTQKRYPAAESLYQEALRVRRQTLGPRHPDYATTVNNLALLYKFQGKYDLAEPLYQEATTIYRETLGAQHPGYATSLNNLALLYSRRGQYQQAESLYQEVIAIFKTVYGPQHPNYATSLYNLAGVYASQGQYQLVEPLYQEIVAISRQTLGTQHPDYGRSLNKLAGLYSWQGRYDLAEPLYQQVVSLFQQVLGTQHPDYLSSLSGLAMLHEAQGYYEQAEPLYQEVAQLSRQILGAQHPDYALSLHNLGVLYAAQGKYQQAETLYYQALEIRKQALGTRHPDYAASLYQLANLYRDQGHYASAKSFYRQAIELDEAVHGREHLYYAVDLQGLAVLYYLQSDYSQAEPLLDTALTIIQKVVGTQHPRYATIMYHLANLYRAQNRVDQAETAYQQALAVRKAMLGTRHPDYRKCLQDFAQFYRQQGQETKAQALMTQ